MKLQSKTIYYNLTLTMNAKLLHYSINKFMNNEIIAIIINMILITLEIAYIVTNRHTALIARHKDRLGGRKVLMK